MIPISGEAKDRLAKKYGKSQNLPNKVIIRPSLSGCATCERYDKGPDLPHIGTISWCVTKYFDRVKKRPVTHYANIALLECCPKMVEKRR